MTAHLLTPEDLAEQHRWYTYGRPDDKRARQLLDHITAQDAELATLRAQVQAGREAALEEAAKICDVWARTVPSNDPYTNEPTSTSRAIASICCDVGQKCATAIRALAQPAKTEGKP